MIKVVIVIAIIVILGGGFFWLRAHETNSSDAGNVAQTTFVTKVGSPSPSASSSSNKSPVSDQQLDQKFQDTQSSLNKLDVDQKAANQDTSSQDTPPVQ